MPDPNHCSRYRIVLCLISTFDSSATASLLGGGHIENTHRPLLLVVNVPHRVYARDGIAHSEEALLEAHLEGVAHVSAIAARDLRVHRVRVAHVAFDLPRDTVARADGKDLQIPKNKMPVTYGKHGL